MPQEGQIQTSALFGILMANLSVGKSEALPRVETNTQEAAFAPH